MADLLIALSVMFGGASLALGGFALGQSVERRRWLEWVRPKKAMVPSPFGGWVGGRFRWRDDFWWDKAKGEWRNGFPVPPPPKKYPVPPQPGFAARRKGERRHD